MPITGTTALLIAAGVSAAGAISQGAAQADRANFEAAVTRQRAGRTREIAAAEEEDFRRNQSRSFAQRRAALGASGIDIGTGSSLLAAGDFAAETELNALRIRAGGKTQATRLEQQAQLLRAGGRSAKQRALFRAGASLLTGFGRAYRPVY